ncbi:MAG: hypothetical protein IPM71_05295 [Bacteroidota bacterium]|nr:MAG: hypothetical protein IPM71_05295 [Bacteroidota bacterium]
MFKRRKNQLLSKLRKFFTVPPIQASVLFVVPVFIVLINIQLSNASGPMSIRFSDPEFIYLFNGMIMAEPNLQVGHIDNPGTPLQVIAAISTRIAHFFVGKESYFDDVLMRPDFYLGIINCTLNSLVGIFSLIFGIGLFKVTGNILISLLVQITPFSSHETIVSMTRVLPDPFIWLAFICLVYYLIKYYFDSDSNARLKHYALMMGLTCGFALSFKFDALSLYLLPLIILPGLKIKIRFLLIGLLSFFVFAFPILFDLDFIFFWLKGLLTHTGKYGYGDPGIINPSVFFDNIQSILKFYPGYKWGLIVVMLSLVLGYFLKPKNGEKLFVIQSALIVTAIFHVLLVAKHFALHYMLPALGLFPLFVFFGFETFNRNRIFLRKLAMISVLGFVTYSFTNQYKKTIQWKRQVTIAKEEVVKEVRTIVGDGKLFIVSQPYNFYFEEQGLVFGYFFTGKYRRQFQSALDRIYPNSFVYDFENMYFRSGVEINPDNFFNPGDVAYVFICSKIADKAQPSLNLLGKLSMKEVYRNEYTNDYLLEVIKVTE